MFVRRKHNKSGTTSIHVVAKVNGKYRVQKSFGSSRDESRLVALEQKARQWADEQEFLEHDKSENNEPKNREDQHRRLYPVAKSRYNQDNQEKTT